jgi:hypothetical protein
LDERLVEHWLTSVNELTYQLPFCEVLLAEGYEVLHVSYHGRGEHGKDVVARRRDGALCTFQLKGGDISLREWDAMRGEVENLVRLPARLPGCDESEPHVPHLVTNGRIRGDAQESIVRWANVWVRDGAGRLEIWQRDRLLRKFVAAHGSYLPRKLEGFRTFVELYVGSFADPLPRERFANFLASLLAPNSVGNTNRRRARAIAGSAVVASYVLEQYERAENHIAALEGWTIVATTILGAAVRDNLPDELYAGSLGLIERSLWRNVIRLESEVATSPSFLGSLRGVSLAAGSVYGSAVTITLGWLCAAQLTRSRFPLDDFAAPSISRQDLIAVIRREYPGARFSGEVDWPYVLSLVWFIEESMNASEGEGLLESWIRQILSASVVGKRGFAPPHWLHEQIFRLNYNMLPPSEHELFSSHSYTAMSALDMLVRRMRRRLVADLYQSAANLDACDFCPDHPADWFLWQAPHGCLTKGKPPAPASWAEWRERTSTVQASQVPDVLRRHATWFLPFLLTFPHRANRTLCAYGDALIGRRVHVI